MSGTINLDTLGHSSVVEYGAARFLLYLVNLHAVRVADPDSGRDGLIIYGPGSETADPGLRLSSSLYASKALLDEYGWEQVGFLAVDEGMFSETLEIEHGGDPEMLSSEWTRLCSINKPHQELADACSLLGIIAHHLAPERKIEQGKLYIGRGRNKRAWQEAAREALRGVSVEVPYNLTIICEPSRLPDTGQGERFG